MPRSFRPVPSRGGASAPFSSSLPLLSLSLALGLVFGCSPEPVLKVLSGDGPIHLEEHLDAARIEGSVVPHDLPPAVEWKGSHLASEWKTVLPLDPGKGAAEVRASGDALRVSLSEANRVRRGLRGGVVVDVPAWDREDFSFLAVEARCAGCTGRLTTAFNLRQRAGDRIFEHEPFEDWGETLDLVGDGSLHRYLIRVEWLNGTTLKGPWRQLGLMLTAPKPLDFDIVSISLIPKEARFSSSASGVVSELRDRFSRRAIFTHAPAKISYRLEVPRHARLDFGLGVVRRDAPVIFRIWTESSGRWRTKIFEEKVADTGAWAQRSLDLSKLGRRTVNFTFETVAPRAGSVGLWASPIVSARTASEGDAAKTGESDCCAAAPTPSEKSAASAEKKPAGPTRPPNVILYVIDAGGAEYSSAYGYNRRTTPNLERLAAEGALFESARSNSTWSKPSTTSFMTSHQHPVLGGYGTPSDPLPENAKTMAQLLHGAGYQTGVFTSNTWCGTMSSLERGVDILQETIAGPNSDSSTELQESFFNWRDAYPGQPYWVHFQHTDVHWPWEAVAPTAGVLMSPQARGAFNEMERKLGTAAGALGRTWAVRSPQAVFDKAGVDRAAYFSGVRDAYDEALAHNDAELGRLVAELKARGEWRNTVLIVTADHGDWPGLGYLGITDEAERIPFLNPYLTHVPLVVVWPGHIAPGRRLSEPVSLLDLLPTVLDLTGQKHPPDLEGTSLAPLLLGKKGWKAKPVVLAEFERDDQGGAKKAGPAGALYGAIEMVDGRWGASLWIGPEEKKPPGPAFLLFDLWRDPYCRTSVQGEHPDLAHAYQRKLDEEFRRQLALAKRFPRAAPGTLNAEQLKTLKSLGYL